MIKLSTFIQTYCNFSVSQDLEYSKNMSGRKVSLLLEGEIVVSTNNSGQTSKFSPFYFVQKSKSSTTLPFCKQYNLCNE